MYVFSKYCFSEISQLRFPLKYCLPCPTLFSLLSLHLTLIFLHLVQSLQAQTYNSWRILFVDGSSGDSHRCWLNDCILSEPRCSWMIQDLSEPGIFGAMNQGFYNSSGSEYVFFWGSDDWASSSNMLSDVVIFLDECRQRKYSPTC